MAEWTFVTHHTRVLLIIARDPTARIQDIATACQVSDRTAQTLVSDLETAGYLSREREGRRTRYTLHLDGPFRHPLLAGHSLRALLDLLTSHPADEGPAGDSSKDGTPPSAPSAGTGYAETHEKGTRAWDSWSSIELHPTPTTPSH
ncbi:helix-turn-helix transcriptional regulator [Streptomyces sp. NPDC029674]|uniref:helix-turn-helix transcriptional regulator n=1 Tax=Streptomyces sp. NPDC029674 TaxID=3365297 RepID=UPI00384C5CE9